MGDLACAATLTTCRTRTKTGTEERASVGGASEASAVVAVAIVQISQSAAMVAAVKNIACHTFHLLFKERFDVFANVWVKSLESSFRGYLRLDCCPGVEY